MMKILAVASPNGKGTIDPHYSFYIKIYSKS